MIRTITSNELKPLVAMKVVTVLDVHRQNNHDADVVKLPGAVWENPDQLADWSAKLPKEMEIINCARAGSVSNSVLDMLPGKGFKARYLEGGIEAWKNAGAATAAK